ncbi:glycosyltransferase family 9 protein [Nocardia vulneris]|uniref:Glycosyl transferase n=1 Tax=Nocardia vulneris TaxID=1141657 RepID=A0ABR4Z3Z9_9NOCA|nr:glycosyltransferase family 9 protein [Nocardia vulneris]KIA60055.1 glycosyl transferase [Nocardia vulneris]
MTGHVLVARLDSAGDVLLAGPAVRAVARKADTLTFLAGPRGSSAAALLPGVDRVLEFEAAWIGADPPPLTNAGVRALIECVRLLAPDEAIIATSMRQSPLPLALLLRMAGVPRISAISPDQAGTLLDVRHRVDDALPEQIRALSLAAAAGYPPGDHRLRVRQDLPEVDELTGGPGYIVLHPGAPEPARRMSATRSREVAAALVDAGHRVVVTGSPAEQTLTGTVAHGLARDLGGATDLAGLAAVLRDADAVVAPNTGAAPLAAAVDTPVVSLFAPVVPDRRWAPYGVPTVVLGNRSRPCGTHCLDAIPDTAIISATELLLRSAG